MKQAFLATIVAVLAGVWAVAAIAGWNGNDFFGTSLNDHPVGNDNANNIYTFQGADFSEGRGGDDRIEAGPGTDWSEGEGGYDTIYACGPSNTDCTPAGEDTMITGSGGGRLNAGQYPAQKQHLRCAGGYDVVYYDSADVGDGTFAMCDEKHKVGPGTAQVLLDE